MNDSRMAELEAKLDVVSGALRKAEERATVGQLALEVLHEIRNPLEALGHLIYLANEDADDAGKIREYMRLAEEQMSQLRHVASQTLGFTRTHPSTKPIDLVALSEAALRIHGRAIRTKKIRLVKRLPEQLVAPVFRGEMLQAISNLLMNAIDALPESGTLHLRLVKCRGEVRLTVADNGHGIPEGHLHAIFEPFFTTKGEDGTGLGLALTKKIIDHHDGKIRVRSSVHPARCGTAFKICLPA